MNNIDKSFKIKIGKKHFLIILNSIGKSRLSTKDGTSRGIEFNFTINNYKNNPLTDPSHKFAKPILFKLRSFLNNYFKKYFRNNYFYFMANYYTMNKIDKNMFSNININGKDYLETKIGYFTDRTLNKIEIPRVDSISNVFIKNFKILYITLNDDGDVGNKIGRAHV